MAWTDVSDFVPGMSRKAKRPYELSDEAQDIKGMIKGARHCTLDFSVAAARDDAKKEEDSGTEEDVPTLVDRAFAAFISTHKLELHGGMELDVFPVPLQCVGSSKRGSIVLLACASNLSNQKAMGNDADI